MVSSEPHGQMKGGPDMGLLDKLKGELVDIIEWIDDSRSTLAWRFSPLSE